MTAPQILYLDCANRTGWAYGAAGGRPDSGSFRCASEGASRGAVFAGAMRWITRFHKDHPIDFLGLEATAAGSNVAGRTTLRTAEILSGLPACFEGMAFILGIYQMQRCAVSSVRAHFIKAGNLKGEIAKPRVLEKCRALGWVRRDDDDQGFDRADALAGWSYCEALIAPKLCQPVDDLFLAAQKRRRDAAELAQAYLNSEPEPH